MAKIKQYEIVRFSITPRCNLRCFYCNNEGQNAPNYYSDDIESPLSLDIFRELISIMKECGVVGGAITGGEPLFEPQWTEYCSILLNEFESSTIHLTTNGTILRKTDLEFFESSNIGRVNISLDTIDEEKYQYITGHNLYENVIHFIEALRKKSVNTNVNVVLLKGINDKEKELKNMISFFNGKTNRLTLCKSVNTPLQPNLCNIYLSNLSEVIRILDCFCDTKNYVDYPNRDRSIVYSYKKLKIHIRDLSSNFNYPPCRSCKFINLCTEGIIHPRMDYQGRVFSCLFREDLSIDFKNIFLFKGRSIAKKSLMDFLKTFQCDSKNWIHGWKK